MTLQTKNTTIQRGDIFWVDLSNQVGSEQGGKRPALVVQNNKGNLYSPTTIVVPLTTKPKRVMPTHTLLTPKECGLPEESSALCEQVRTIDKSRILDKIGELLNHNKFAEINQKLKISMGL